MARRTALGSMSKIRAASPTVSVVPAMPAPSLSRAHAAAQ